MLRGAIQELFDYTSWAWERLERVIDGLPDGTYEASAPGSGWPSIAACVTHFVGATDGWLNMEWGGIQVGELSYPAEWPNPVEDWAEMKAYYRRCQGAFRTALEVPDEVLYEKREYRLFENEDTVELMSRADILTNLVLHERGHHGDLNTLFHQLGIRSYIMDYRYFRTLPERFVMDTSE